MDKLAHCSGVGTKRPGSGFAACTVSDLACGKENLLAPTSTAPPMATSSSTTATFRPFRFAPLVMPELCQWIRAFAASRRHVRFSAVLALRPRHIDDFGLPQ
jgi:hypothetical protein